MGKIASFKDILVGSLIFIAVAALGLSAFAFTQPDTRSATDQIAYEQQGTFSYVAQDTQGIYDNGFVETGEPVFRKFTDAITSTFTYVCSCSTIQNVSGTYRLYAEVSDSSGWKAQHRIATDHRLHGHELPRLQGRSISSCCRA